MNFKRRGKIAAICMAFMMCATQMAYAQSFTDVSNEHWASKYVETAVEKGLMKGVGDGTVFEPNKIVTQAEAMTILSHFYKVSDAEKKAAVIKYTALFDKVAAPQADREGIAIAILKGITNPAVVEATFYEKGQAKAITKEMISIGLVRAMGLEQMAKDKAFTVSRFLDSELMTEDVRKYVEVMVEKELIDEKGDANGKFNPKEKITRAVMAKLVVSAYEIANIETVKEEVKPPVIVTNDNTTTIKNTTETAIKETDKKVETTNTEDKKEVENKDKVTYEKWTSDLLKVALIDGKLMLQLEDINKGSGMFALASNAIVTVNGDIADSSNLKEKMIVNVVISSKNEITEVHARTYANIYTGKVDKLEKTGARSIKISYIENDLIKYKTVNVNENTEILIDGFRDDLTNLYVGNDVIIRSNDRDGVQIIKKTPERVVVGNFKEVKYSQDKIEVVINKGENVYRYKLENIAVPVSRNSRTAKIYDLRLGDSVSITLKNNQVQKIESSAVSTKAEGVIKKITFDENGMKLEVELKLDGLKVYDVLANTNIEIGSQKNKTIYDLRVGYGVNLEVQSGEIVNIITDAATANFTMNGKVMQVFASDQVIIFQTKEGDTVYIKADSATKFVSMDGKNINLSNLGTGSNLLVSVEKIGNAYQAKQIIVIE